MNTRTLMVILELATLVAKLIEPPWNRFPRHFILYLVDNFCQDGGGTGDTILPLNRDFSPASRRFGQGLR
jgi:hypothetical protein